MKTPKYPGVKPPDGYNCWAYDKNTGNVVTANYIDGIIWSDDSKADLVMLFDPIVDKWALAICSIVFMLVITAYFLGLFARH